MIETVKKLLAPLQRRIMSMIARGVVQAIKDGKLQKVQMTALADEVLDGLEYVEPYGFTSIPEQGAEAVALFLGGDRGNGIVLSVGDRRYRLQGLASGEVAIYHKGGSKILLKADGKMQIHNGTYELFTVLSDFLAHLIAARTATLAGPQPLLGVDFPADKAKIDSFKV